MTAPVIKSKFELVNRPSLDHPKGGVLEREACAGFDWEEVYRQEGEALDQDERDRIMEVARELARHIVLGIVGSKLADERDIWRMARRAIATCVVLYPEHFEGVNREILMKRLGVKLPTWRGDLREARARTGQYKASREDM